MTKPPRVAAQPGRSSRRLYASLLVVILAGATSVLAQYPAGLLITKDGTTVLLQDYATVPLSSPTAGSYPPAINFSTQLGRVNFLRSEPSTVPSSSARFFVNDLNRTLYILNKANKTFTPYLNFEEIFPKFDNTPGYAGGLVTFAFGPDYASSGTFYTVHTEDPARSGSPAPTNALLPDLDLRGGYTTTATANPPAGPVVREAVLVEWRDTNIGDTVFQGTAREVMRVGFNGNIHPMGDLLFNPTAFPGDSDYGNLYVATGDGSSGETPGDTHATPQRLDALQGKILRITPDTTLRPGDAISANQRYRIPTTGPDPNPFASLTLPNLKRQIYAYGFRNPHRLSWNPTSHSIIVNDIGLNSWEEVNLLTKGGNYGYAEREGDEQLFVGGANGGKTGGQTNPPTPFPSLDTLAVAGITAPVTPVYPALAYSHQEGDAISSGFVYRGALLPQLFGKYIFGDISTGRLFYADLADMMAATRIAPAVIHEIQVVYSSPFDSVGPVKRRLYDIVADAYLHKGGKPQGVLPGSATVVGGATPGHVDIEGVRYGGGRADIRLAEGGDGELFVLSKSDGMIRAVLPASSSTPRYYQLVARHSGKCLDVSGASVDDGAAVIQWTCHGGTNQSWSLVPLADGTYHIVARHSGKLLDVFGASLNDLAPIIQYAADGGDNQKWSLVAAADGYYQLLAHHSGKAIDVTGASLQDGAAAIQYTPHNGANQQWLLRALP